ncbi:MAG: hypothetical protein AAB649_00285 [Patescibacteria group bacterium]
MDDELNDEVKNKLEAWPLPSKQTTCIRSIRVKQDGQIIMAYGVKFGHKWWLKHSKIKGDN